MEVGPPGSPCRRRSQTTAVSCRSRAGVGSDWGKDPLSAGQVSDEKTNVCEPLLTHRKPQRWHRNQGRSATLGQRRALDVSSAGELPVCGPSGARCIGGVSSSQALAWNRRTCRLGMAGQSNGWGLPPGRQEGEPSWSTLGESTDPGHRDGPARSSDEGPVMGLERRGRAGQVTLRSTLRGRSRWADHS